MFPLWNRQKEPNHGLHNLAFIKTLCVSLRAKWIRHYMDLATVLAAMAAFPREAINLGTPLSPQPHPQSRAQGGYCLESPYREHGEVPLLYTLPWVDGEKTTCKPWGTLSGAKSGWAFCFGSSSQIKGQGLPLPTALATSLWKIKFCCSVFAILTPPHPKSGVRSKGKTHLNKISSCNLKSTTAGCPQLWGWAQTSALLPKQQQSSQRFSSPAPPYLLGFCKESAGLSASSHIQGCLPKRPRRTPSSSSRGLSYLYR